MYQVLVMVEYLLGKYGKNVLEDKDRVFSFMDKCLIPSEGIHVKIVKFLYDSGIVRRLAMASPKEREKALVEALIALEKEFPHNDELTETILPIVAKCLGFPLDMLETYCKLSLKGMREPLSSLGNKTTQELEAIEEYILGNFYQSKGDHDLAVDHWLKAAQAGNVLAMMYLAAEFYPGEKVGKLYTGILESGNGLDLYEAGFVFILLKDYDRAEKLLRKSADLGVAIAMYRLYELYENTLNDPVNGMEWLVKAADAGDSLAQITMGIKLLDEGKNEEALSWLLKEVRPHHSKIMESIALVYEVKLEDYSNAKKWHLKAALAGDADAMARLGNLYETVFHDDKKAVKCYQKSMAEGSAEGEGLYKEFLKKRKTS